MPSLILVPQVKESDLTITTLYAMCIDLDVVPRQGELFALHESVYEVHAIKHIIAEEDMAVKFISNTKPQCPCIEVYLRRM